MSTAVTTDRAKEIKSLHQKIKGAMTAAMKKSLPDAIQIGKLLTEQKAELKHTEFGKWLDANVIGPDISRATVNNYMKLFKEKDNLKILNVRNLAEAYRVLYRKPEPELTAEETTTDDASEDTTTDNTEEDPTTVPTTPEPLIPFGPNIELTEVQAKELNDSIRQLGEVLGLDNTADILIRALRYATNNMKECDNDQVHTPAENFAESLGEGTIQQTLTTCT